MGDNSSNFINAFIDHAVGTLHEQLSQIIHLKAQYKLAEDMIAERDKYIEVLKGEIENSKRELSDNKTDVSTLAEKTNEVIALKTQLNHMKTFSNQVNQMKKMLIEKDKEIEIGRAHV